MAVIGTSYLAMCILALNWALSYQQAPGLGSSLNTAYCNYQLDLVFAIDGSNSMLPNNFLEQKDAMVNLVNNLNISPRDIKVGLVLFSNSVQSFPLIGDRTTVVNEINSFAFPDASTYTHLAINEATRLFRSARGGNVKKLLIIITDGRSTVPSQTLQAANIAKQSGISIYTVGVTEESNTQELVSMASSSTQVYHSANYHALRQDLLRAVNQACVSIVTQPCDLAQLDLAFVLDSNMGVNSHDFQLLKNFVKRVLDFPDVDSGSVRVSVATYSNGGYVQFGLNTYRRKTDMYQAIDNLQYTPGFSNPASMLEGLRTAVFTPSLGDRPEAPNVVVMVMNSLSDFNAWKATQEAEITRNAGIHIYGVETTPPATAPPPPPQCFDQLDLVIAIDSSDSINPFNFQTLKNAVSNLVNSLRVSARDIRVGMVLFSRNVTAYPIEGDKAAVIRTVSSMPYLDETTRTDLAIIAASQLFASYARGGNVRKLLMIVTDGRATFHGPALAAANIAKRSGITIYSVGVTDAIDEQELRDFASAPGMYFHSDDFDTLKNDLLRAATRACQSVIVNTPPPITPVEKTNPSPVFPIRILTKPPKCFDQLDLVIAIDSSNSINPVNFEILKQAVGNLVNNLKVTDQDIRVGLIHYSNTVTTYALRGNKQQILNDIVSLKHIDSSTRTDLAIREAYNLFSRFARGGTVGKLLLIITDGRATDPARAIAEADIAKRAGITIYVLGVTSATDQTELERLASWNQKDNKPQVSHSVNFITLINSLIEATTRACQSVTPNPTPVTPTPTTPTIRTPPIRTPPPPTAPPQCFDQLDLVIAVDSSDSINPVQFRDLKMAVATLVNSLQVTPQDIRVGLTIFSTTVTSYPLSGDKRKLLQTIYNFPHLDDQTRTDIAIGASSRTFNTGARGGNVRKLLIIITDGRATDHNKAIAEAQRAKNSGITIYAVGVTDAVDDTELRKLASNPNQIKHSANFQALRDDLINAATEACQSGNTGTGPTVVGNTNMCTNSGHLGGVNGYVAHPTECNKYVLCYYNPTSKKEVAVIKNCPLGLFWNSRNNRCDLPTVVRCSNDLCGAAQNPYSLVSSSRSYWTCNNRISLGACCPLGQRFSYGLGCIANANSKETCSIARFPQTVSCPRPPGCRDNDFDIVTCSCSAKSTNNCRPFFFSRFTETDMSRVDVVNHGVTPTVRGAIFQESSWMQANLNSWNANYPLTFTIRYRQSARTAADTKNSYILVSSHRDCAQPDGSLYIFTNPNYVTAQIHSPDLRMARIDIPLKGHSATDLKELTFTYNQRKMTVALTIGQFEYIEQIDAPEGITLPCGLDIGRGSGLNPGFAGTVEQLSIYSCSLSKLY